ncbi:MAG: M12 family metallo-peptidase [Pirellulaceae bacterium]|nr:M12 family metallo-peptidase [Pirellulaceae bacterium]
MKHIMKTPTTLRAATLSVATFAALCGAQTANAQSIWDVLKAKAPGLASVMEAVVVNNSQAPMVVVQPQASAATQVPAAAATPAPQASPVSAAAPAAKATTPAPSPAAQAGNGLKKGFDAMKNRRPAEASELPKHAKAQSGVVGDVDPGVMSASEVSLTLADGTVLTARLQRVASNSKFNSQTWIGTIDGAEGSVLALTKARGVVTGFANYQSQILEIQPTAGGKHVLFGIDESSLPKGELVHGPKIPADTSGTTSVGASSTAAASSVVVQDVLVLYTAATASRHGQASIESQIQSAVQAANQAYQNSAVGITLNLVGMQQSTVVEQSDMQVTLSVLQSDAGVTRLRDQVAADMVMLISENSNYCGQANLMTANSVSFAPYAFGVVYSSCLSNQSLAHEFGHQQGLMHDRASSSGWTGVYPYSYGYARCTSDSTAFRDVMSYPCGSAPRVLLFSNPDVTWNGYAAGISYEMDPANSAEAARSLNSTAATVAAFRGSSSLSPSATPTAPSGLAVQSAAYNKVTLGWTDNSTNESGFKLERSTNGVDFAEIATLAADTRSYTDATVVAKTTYYFRVRAYNGSGTSSYSATINVTTPDQPLPPPSAPSGVAAVDGKDGTALVSWGAGGSSATSYEVRREKWDTRKLAWSSAMVAATVPASALSLVDSTGAGQFRYSVRALNSSGASGYAGPVEVIVTTPTTTAAKGKGPIKK